MCVSKFRKSLFSQKFAPLTTNSPLLYIYGIEV